jgi:hypothetical protein
MQEIARMAHKDELVRLVRRNKLIGMWAADQLGLEGEAAQAYSNEIGLTAADNRHGDVLARIRKDFAAAGVVRTDEEILSVMNAAWLDAGDNARGTGTDPTRAAIVQIARHLTSG